MDFPVGLLIYAILFEDGISSVQYVVNGRKCPKDLDSLALLYIQCLGCDLYDSTLSQLLIYDNIRVPNHAWIGFLQRLILSSFDTDNKVEDIVDFLLHFFNHLRSFDIFFQDLLLWIKRLDDLLYLYLAEAFVKLGWGDQRIDQTEELLKVFSLIWNAANTFVDFPSCLQDLYNLLNEYIGCSVCS